VVSLVPLPAARNHILRYQRAVMKMQKTMRKKKKMMTLRIRRSSILRRKYRNGISMKILIPSWNTAHKASSIGKKEAKISSLIAYFCDFPFQIRHKRSSGLALEAHKG